MCDLEVLYHYTTLSTFEKIIKNGYFAMFDILKSNDPLEGIFSITAIKDAYANICLSDELDDEKLLNMRTIYHDFLDEVESFGKLHNVICSLSFCKPNHKLLLWRTYGDNGKGIAIGVGKIELEKFNNYDNFEFKKVEYKSRKDYTNIAKELLIEVASMSKEAGLSKLNSFYNESYFIKEAYNSDENEYRLIYKGVDLENYILPSTGEKIPNVEMLVSENNDMKIFYQLVIHKNTNDNQNPFLKINDIIIGSNCLSKEQEIRLFLRLHDIDDCSIFKDDVSMR